MWLLVLDMTRVLIILLCLLIPTSQAQASQVGTESYGVKCNGVTDDTAGLQQAINAAVNSTLFIQQGSCIITSPLVIPSSIKIIGIGEGSGFSSAIRPVNTTAFIFDNVHHSTLIDVMIWPKDTSPLPIVEIKNSYSVTLESIRFHIDTAQVPSSAISLTKTISANNDIKLNRVTIRSQLQNLPVALYFGPSFGTATILQADLENADRCVRWDGGNIFFLGLYTETCSVHAIHMEPLDANASLTLIGGFIHAPSASVALGIRAGAKNVYVAGTWIGLTGTALQGHVYSLAGSSNIRVQLANPVAGKFTSVLGDITQFTTR